MIKAQLESRLFQYFKDRIIETPETYFHAVGGAENHIHLAVSISPKLEIAKWIGQLKGASSHHINKSASRKLLEWQNGYGVVSFGTKDLPWIIKYTQNQKEHHRTQKTFERLEKIEC